MYRPFDSDNTLLKASYYQSYIYFLKTYILYRSFLEDKLVYVRNPLKKSNISLLLDALFEACEIRNVKIIVALVMALNNIAGNERSMRIEIKELNTICYDFYE